MAKQNTLYLPIGYRASSVTTLVNADSTNLKDLVSAGTDDSRVVAIAIASSDGTARDVLLYLSDSSSSGTSVGSGDALIGHIDVPANSGFDGTVNSVNGLNANNLPWSVLDIYGNRFIPLPATKKLRIAAKVAVTAAATVTVTAIVEDF
jgi:hypothetical protein